MKTVKYIIGCFLIVIIGASCQKNFLNKDPLDQVTSAVFFTKSSDLELYMNAFYSSDYNILDYGKGFTGNNYSSLIFLSDMGSDNSIDQAADSRLNGLRVLPASGGGWDFTYVRTINYFFDNYKKCADPLSSYQQYLGEAYFFKALIYFQLVKKFGAVPWYDKALETNSPELYGPRTPRNTVVDHILSDLDSAALYLDETSRDGGNRLDRWSALLMQSRIALYEGTWEKYHATDSFSVSGADPNKYLNKAVAAASEIMQSGKFAIYSTGKPAEDYFNLFDTHDYSGTKEVLLWKRFDKSLGIINYRMVLGEWPRGYGITKGLADSYLCTDGKPISVSPLFQGHNSLANESQNRDPRFKQTIFTQDAPYAFAGVVYPDWNTGMYTSLFQTPDYTTPTGYVIRKGTTYKLSEQNYSGEDEPIILYDYAEVLLNYAEAKAELNTLTQGDIDISVKLLRDRVGMPNLVLSSIVPDPNWDFSNLSPAINEIRRERRIELALVGFRWDDIARWAAADELIKGKRPKGAAWGSTFPPDPFPNDANGFMDPFASQAPAGYGFKLNRDYLDPLPTDQLTLNKNLTQNPGW